MSYELSITSCTMECFRYKFFQAVNCTGTDVVGATDFIFAIQCDMWQHCKSVREYQHSDFCGDSGIVLTSEEISMEPVFSREGGHLCRVSTEWSQHEPLCAE